MQRIKDTIVRVKVGESQSFNNLSVFPILGTRHPQKHRSVLETYKSEHSE